MQRFDDGAVAITIERNQFVAFTVIHIVGAVRLAACLCQARRFQLLRRFRDHVVRRQVLLELFERVFNRIDPAEHAEILARIEAKDPDGAAESLRKHVHAALAGTMDYLASREIATKS